ncbi:competence protein ComEC [Segetibacter aerophilus]|uniref:Competence protein ComEC n=1 Tax=Segetibacter aerophilus TaxID=670293 RepID=A0A512BFB0_9BACT|nr:competence protein ComEC [Segetibacter aerophilus]
MHKQDSSNKKNWIGNCRADSVTVLITLQEPLIEKAKTYKAEATVDAVYASGDWKEATGRMLVYFSKDNIQTLTYGSQILFDKRLQQIKNSGNPGGFDYKQYTAFQGIFHQVFLKGDEYRVASSTNGSAFKNWLFNVRGWVIKKLQEYIKPDREAGVAEALLIGYRNDLDKDLVQAYSNTGVVHIIAISGLHLGMIYMVLVWLMRPFRRTKWIRLVKPIIILTVLWVFTLLAGGVPSILRSAVMFSFIVLGETLNRKSSIYNTLASSAFVMLCVNPYYLWDAGFQLSYAAVIGIITFQKPVYNWFYLKNKSLDFLWKLTSVTIAAQVLTIPVIFYAFHQFPTFFLLTNMVIVPLSSLVLFAELTLLIVSFAPAVANFVGIVTSGMLAIMNGFIERVNSFPYAVYDGIQNSLVQTILLYILIISIGWWLLNKTKRALFIGLTSMLLFIAIDSYEDYGRRGQEKMIVYNIPQRNAIDFVAGKQYAFTGDAALLADKYLENFHLKPSRTLHQVGSASDLEGLYISKPFFWFGGKRILVVDKSFRFESAARIFVDVIIISHNPRFSIDDLVGVFNCKQFVFDGSNSAWKINQWKKDCERLHLPNYSTSDNGAFVLDL